MIVSLAVVDASNVIEKAKIKGIDDVFTINLPQEMVENTDKTLVLITDANTNVDLSGSNHFHGLRRMVEVQVFFSENPTDDPENITVNLYRAFESNGWEIGENHGYTKDVDTDQLTTVFYVTDLKIV